MTQADRIAIQQAERALADCTITYHLRHLARTMRSRADRSALPIDAARFRGLAKQAEEKADGLQ